MPITENMASILETYKERARASEPVAIVDAAEFEEAQQDPRVKAFLAEADSYLAALERQGRNH
jgi:hypothetical protein